mmetsp:Transcript_24578/g.85443  ORF Transcript_24578/g.85443 Transcript_24578/m.85443 type:complete len:271 (-) Transcript_24578:4219-5031(-)
MAFSSVPRFAKAEVYISERKKRLKETMKDLDKTSVYAGVGKQLVSTQRTEPRVFFTTAPRFGSPSPGARARPSTAPAAGAGGVGAPPPLPAADLPEFTARQVLAGRRTEPRVVFKTAPRFPEDAKRKGRARGRPATASDGNVVLESRPYSSFGKQAFSTLRSSGGTVFPTASRRVTATTPVGPDVNPEQAKPSKLKRYPAAHFGSQRRFESGRVFGLNLYASPGPAAVDSLPATLKVQRQPARQPAWAKPAKVPSRHKNGRPKNMDIYRF